MEKAEGVGGRGILGFARRKEGAYRHESVAEVQRSPNRNPGLPGCGDVRGRVLKAAATAGFGGNLQMRHIFSSKAGQCIKGEVGGNLLPSE